MRNPRQARNTKFEYQGAARQSKRFAEQRRKRLLWVSALLIVGAGGWLYSLSALTRLGAFTVNDIQVIGADADIASSVESAAASALAGSYLHLFARSNDLIYPQTAVAAAVEAVSPRISSVTISRDGWQGLTVTVVEKAPGALVCANLPDFSTGSLSLSDSGPCYYADPQGLIFEAADTASSSPRYFIPDLGDGAAAIIGSYATSSDEWAALQAFYSGLQGSTIKPEGVLMKGGGEYELYVDDPASSGSASASAGGSASASATDGASPGPLVIYFNDVAGLSQELSDLVSFWGGVSGPFDYIDLRYPPNVFYRLTKPASGGASNP